MFILPVRGPLFMDNWRTQIIIPLEWKICFYYLQSFAMSLCTLTLPSDCLFIITAFLLSQWGSGQFWKVPSLFQPFPVCDIIVYSPKTHWSVSCLQPGWHTSHATKVKHKVHTFWLCPLDMYQRTFLVLDAIMIACLNHGVILHDQCAFHCDETLTCYGFTFWVEICNLPT